MLKLLLVGLLLLEPTGIPDPLTLVVHDQAFIIPRSELALPVWMTPDIAAIQKWVDRAGKLVYTAPQNAIWLGPGKYTPGQNGKQLDQKLLMEQMLGYVLQTGPLTIQAETKVIYPKVDTELLTEITHKAIAHYATYFNVHNDSRAHNIRLAVAAINSTVVFPGETFSFNDTVGIRSKKKGYLNAPIIVRGELSEGIGGGICQVSSTLFNAVDQAGLKVVMRYSHSRHVPYVLPGRDATVSWHGPDFAFRNEYNQPVIIKATVAGGGLYVSIYSSEVIRFKSKSIPPVSHALPEEQPSSEVWDKKE